MKNRFIKKYSVLFVMGVYALSTFLQSLSFFDFNKVYAQESQLDYTNLVAVLVDDKIYDSLENEIERYAKKYIQGSDSNTRYNAIPNSRAIVLPVNIENITAPEITKILENMYFDGISGEPSKLIGVILIGEIPLPVVNQNGFVYPTIYPYVDFEEQKFIWNDEIKYFTYNDNPKGQAEIRHGLISFEKIEEYKQYFNKLEKYSKQPDEFIGKNIWYEDMIANKKYFYQEALGSYINNFLFTEDIGYRRYSDLMLKLMQGSHNDMVSELLDGFDGAEQLKATTENISTPTMSLEKMIKEGYLNSYTNLFGGKHLDTIVKNVETANRRVEAYTRSDGYQKNRTALDTHYIKMEQKDETLLRTNGGIDPLIILMNNAMEEIVNEKIEQEKYWLNEVIPLTYLKYDGHEKLALNLNGSTCTWKEYSAYENYFFGSKARNISSMQETSTYRGTFRNFDDISGLKIEDIQKSNIPSIDIDVINLNKKSIGGSYDIFALQVDANRGYNIMNSVKELEIYNKNKIPKREYRNTKCDKKFLGICWRKRRRESDIAPTEHLCDPNNKEKQAGCEIPQEFAIRNRGGASPLNLSGMDDWTNGYNFQDAELPVFNIAGSKAITGSEVAANSYEAVNKYTRLIQQTFVPNQSKYYTKNKEELSPDLYAEGYNSNMGEDMKFTNRLPIGNLDQPTWMYTNPLKISSVDFFSKFDNTATREGDIIKIKKEYDTECVGRGEIYTYKTLDSRIRNNLSTHKQINGTTYNIFQDDNSPSKTLYEGIIDKVEITDDLVQRKVDRMSINYQSGLTYNLHDLKTYIDGIKSEISKINNYPLSNLSNLNGIQIKQLANLWSNSFKQKDLESVTEKSENIKNQLLELDGFASDFSYDYIRGYIQDELNKFNINGWQLIFLNSWKNNMLSKLVNTKNKFYSMEGLVLNAKNEYNNIQEIPGTLNSLLLAKKTAINIHVTDSSGLSLGCNTYADLCNAIDTVRNNLSNYRTDVNDKVDEIIDFDFQDFDLDGSIIGGLINIKPFNSIANKIERSDLNNDFLIIQNRVNTIPSTNNINLTGVVEGMNMTTSDRPIDSPRYITFKGIGGDKVTLIYPNIYKSEVFTGNTDILKLKSPEDIASAIKTYLRETVKKYNEYLQDQKTKSVAFYNQNPQAYNKLNQQDPLANPISSGNTRKYSKINDDYLIDELEKKLKYNAFFTGNMGGLDPIEFIAHMIYYQNIGWQQRKIGKTIQDDINNTIADFDVNEKITHILDNYLISDNNSGNLITPGYRDNGYEVAFINSDGDDHISAKAEPVFVQNIKSASNNYTKPSIKEIEQNQLAEELQNECNIPESEGVLLFDLSDMSSPWMNALQCRRAKIKNKPFEFSFDWSSIQGPMFSPGNEGDSIGEIVLDNLGVNDIQDQYMNQLGYLETATSNQQILDNSNPGDYQKLEKIISYTKIETKNTNINADIASGTISIRSNIELGDIEFHIKNVGSSIFNLNNMSENITEGATGYMTGKAVFDPFDSKNLDFQIQNPIAGTNVLVFYMCLPNTQNIENCVKKSLKLNIIPGEIKNINIETAGDVVLQGSKIPVIVKGVDEFGNNVGQLFTEKFNISTDIGLLSHQSSQKDSIIFSNFNKSSFILNTEKDTPNNTEINIEANGPIGGDQLLHASKKITVRKGLIKTYQNNDPINSMIIDLPLDNDYSYKDSFNLTQINLATLPKVTLKLQDETNQSINIESIVNISSKNGLFKPGEVNERYITKTQNNMSFDVNQKRFSQKNNFVIQSGELIIYLMPNFKAGDDILSISMPGIETINLPVTIKPAPASIIEISSKKDTMSINSSTNAKLKITDNWGNIIKTDTLIKLGVIGPISISGTNNTSSILNIENGEYIFTINSKEKGGEGFVYSTIDGLSLSEQKPGQKSITIQNKILPEKNLNIMYLNLFGSDRGNQRGFLSDNNKYVQNLIINSKRLITTTTQLTNPDNIKKFPIIIQENLNIKNENNKDIKIFLNQDIYFNIENVGEVKINVEGISIQAVDVSEENKENVIEKLIENKYKNKNVLIYMPEDTDSIIESNEIKNNAIWINNQKVFDLDNQEQSYDIKITLTEDDLLGKQIREVLLGSKKIGELIFVTNNKDSIQINLKSTNPKYDYDIIWIDGSTNRKGFGFYEIDSKLPNNTMGYKSIQDSKDPTLGIGFTADFKNITEFGAGKSVGESTINFASEFLINIGDPLLKRISNNVSAKMLDEDSNIEIDSKFDKGIGEVIYSEPGKTIFKVINIDFNNDGLEDIIVAFNDGTVKILKNYGGKNPFKNLGDLMILTDGIKEIIVGDVDGNGYKDILIRSKSDLLRVYKNDLGIFDVDGLPICINTNVKDGLISKKPQEISGVNQIFFEDMDGDGNLDIVTNDKLGHIKIFYGGVTNNQDNYVSTNKNMCDNNWHQRQNNGNNTNVVYRFGIRIDENTKVLDQSLVRWKGIDTNNDIQVSAEDLGINTDMFDENNMDEDNIGNILAEAMNFNIQQAEKSYKSSQRYKKANFKKIPIYENLESDNDVNYVEIGCLTGNDPVKIYKKYEDLNGDVLENNDKVQVTITIKANENFTGTFVDNIIGPWIIPLTGDMDMIENFWFETGTINPEKIENQLKFYRDMVNSRYMIDNISMNSGEEIKINYWLFYNGDINTNTIQIQDIDGKEYPKFNGNTGEVLSNYKKDNLPDIKIKPTDGCNKSMFVLFNENLGQKKEYTTEYIDLSQLLINFTNTNKGNLENAMSEITNSLASNAGEEKPNFDNIPSMSNIIESINLTDVWSNSFSIDEGINLTNIANVPGQIIDGLLGDVMDKVDGLMGDACKGFDLSEYGIGGSENCGLPVPFNQAFLGPGNYHLFGCFDLPVLNNTIGGGIPILFSPSTLQTPVGPIPSIGPWLGPQKMTPTDGFDIWPGGGAYPSQFRLYVMPTLTAEIGIAMCFGPYNVGTAIPDPASSIGGNCIVTAIPLPCKDEGSISGPNSTNTIPEAFLDMETCTSQNIPCYIGEGESTSSLEIVSSSSSSTNMTAAVPDGSFAGGFISIEKTPITQQGYKTPESGIEIDGVKLFGGAEQQNKILGSNAQGLIEKVSKKWMDAQINYIFNNLSNFKVDVAWPDFDNIIGGVPELFKNSSYDEKEKECKNQEGIWDETKRECIPSEKQLCINRGMERNAAKKVCEKKTNPNQNEESLNNLDAWAKNNLLSRSQITDLSESKFANPFDKMEAMFEEVPLINIRTENITVKVPMISSEDITAYISMSKNWIAKQEKILEEWLDLFKALIGFCGGRTNIKDLKDLNDATEELKEKLKEESNKTKDISIEEAKLNQSIDSIKRQISQIKDLNKKYDLSYLGNYSIFESCDLGKYYIKVDNNDNLDSIIPYDIYVLYHPGNEKELSMFTKGFNLVEEKKSIGKNIISYTKTNENVSNEGICIKSFVSSTSNQCTDLFLGGKFDRAINNFINIQSNTSQLINSVKQNIDTLELYKKFPIDLYEWMHVGDRYMSEISSIINNFLGTLSIWMKTNATRYSQYVDSLILAMTTIQTYQAIIDLSKNRSERCSSCTNDNYDQFACKLGMLCPDGALPVLEIPPMKIPSIFIDLSKINLGTDVKLPKFNFVPTSVPLPSLPNIPSPPSFDVSLDMEQSLNMGMNLVGELMVKLDIIDNNIVLPSMPVIPAPPDLPEIPSFLPSVKLELPLLPPAPKIPKLPNEIKAAIDTAEVIGKILCIVKGNIGLVGEDSIKAKVEQMTQRTYEVPYWDNFDQTLSERNTNSKTKIPDRISDIFGFLKANEFKDVELKGFDIGVESNVNLQFKFDGFYDFINSVVSEINEYSSMPQDFIQGEINEADSWSRALEQKMSACVSNPISESCLGKNYTGEIKELKEKQEEMETEMRKMGNNIKNGFGGIKEALQEIAKRENEKETLKQKNIELEEKIEGIKQDIENDTLDLSITTNEERIVILNNNINKNNILLENHEQEIKNNEGKINIIEEEINELYTKYGGIIESYEDYLENYEKINDTYNKSKEKLNEYISDLLEDINKTIGSGDEILDDLVKFEKLDERNTKIQIKMDEFNQKEEVKKEVREENIKNLYKEISPDNFISYADYEEKTYKDNIKTIKDSLNMILEKSNDNNLDKKVEKYIAMIDLNKEIKPAKENIGNIEKQYNNIVKNIKEDNKLLSNMILDDYDKFLYAVGNNKMLLVNNDDTEISLSTNLFDIEKNTLDTIKQQENPNKMYIDYYKKNIDGYLGAIENYSYEELNMDLDQYEHTKKYLENISEKTNLAYEILDNKFLLTQNNQNPGVGSSSSNGSYVDISSYINVIKTPEGSINLANKEYVKNFQGKTLMVDINKDDKNDLIMWDKNNIYLKYRDNNEEYGNLNYNNKYYKYKIESYKKLLDDSEDGFVKINDIYVKLCDWDWEVKNFKYSGGDFDSIKISWMNSQLMGDIPKGYLLKMVHRVDLFNDKELIVSDNNRDLIDKKYILILPKGSIITGTKIGLEEGIFETESILSGLILDVVYYNENQNNINLTIKEIPRNWQYSEIYTLDTYNEGYIINSPSSNQIVGGPQLIGDNKGPIPTIKLNRPSINEIVDTGERFDIYVSTNYKLVSEREDNVAIDKLWITDSQGNIIKEKNNINQKTGYIELDGLFFTGMASLSYYFVGTDINGNIESKQVTLNIKKPNIEIINIEKYGNEIENIASPATITAEIDHDIDEGYVQFLRNRNGIWQTITGTLGGIEIDKYSLDPLQTIITGGYYDFGNDIGLYLQNGNLAVKINPKNGSINIIEGFENLVNIDLDYSMKIPMIKISESNGDILFWISLKSKELINIETDLEIRDLKGDVFGDFNGGKAIIENDEILMYIDKIGNIYTEGGIYGEYIFDENQEIVVYTFRKTRNGDSLGNIKIKVKNLLGE